MDPLTLVLLVVSFIFVVAVGVWLGAGYGDMFEGMFAAGALPPRPRGVQETDVPRFHIDPLVHPV